jgi:SEC-C motif-containing protein
MRSRFSAFALGNPAYLLASWHPSTRPRTLELDPGLRWYRLDIVGTTDGGIFDTVGTVRFRAYFRGDAVGVQAEDSRFVREGRRWFYLDGVAADG